MATVQLLTAVLLSLVKFWQTNGQDVTLSLNDMSIVNNSILAMTAIGSGSAALVCTTTRFGCCVKSLNPETQWYFPNGTQVSDNQNLPYQRSRTVTAGPGGTVRLNHNSESTTTGIFHCDIPDASNVTQSLYVGIYTHTAGGPNATSLIFDHESRTLTCTSTGGPATNVTWIKGGMAITLNATYRQTQRITNLVNGTYQTMLSIALAMTDINDTYSCVVENTRGMSTAITKITDFRLQITITTVGAGPTAGQSYTLICAVTPLGGLVGAPTVQWMGPGSSDSIVNSSDFTVSSTQPYTLTINRLNQSHDGQYICQATIGSVTGSRSTMLTVADPLTVAAAIILPPGPFTAGQSYTLNCAASVHGGENLSTTTTITWIQPSGNMTSRNGRSLSLSLHPLQVSDAGNYTCTVSVCSPFLTGFRNSSRILTIEVMVPKPTVNVAVPGNSVYAGSNVTLRCEATLSEGVTTSNVEVEIVWMKNNTVIMSSALGRIRYKQPKVKNGTQFIGELVFSPLSSSLDNGTYTCVIKLIPKDQIFIIGAMESDTEELLVAVPTLSVNLTPNATHLPNVTPYNSFFLTCTTTSSVEGVGNVNLPKRFAWRRRYGSSVTQLTKLSSNDTIQIVDGHNLDQSTSTSMLIVTEKIPQLYRYRCRVDLNLSEDQISEKSDVYPITVSELVSVTAGRSPILGLQYHLTCSVTLSNGIVGAPKVQWMGPGRSNVIATDGDFIVSRTSPYTLTINPLRQHHTGQYTCLASVGGVSGTASVMVNVTAPSLTVDATITALNGPFTAGQSYTLTCTANVIGGESLSASTRILWIHPSKNLISGTGSSLELTINSLQVSDAGQYTCIVNVSSSLLTPPQNSSDSVTIDVTVPPPTVNATLQSPEIVAFAGNNGTLKCDTTLMGGVTDAHVTVDITWTKDGTAFSGVNGRVKLLPQQRINNSTYSRQLMFSPLSSTMDNGTYRCVVNLTSQLPGIVTSAKESNSVRLAVKGPSSPLEPSHVMHTGITHNSATIQWIVPMIVYTPETYMIHFGNTSGSLTPFNSQRHSGENLTATNLMFSIELTGLAAGIRYYYEVVAVNSLPGSVHSVEQNFTTKELHPSPPRVFKITTATTNSLSFSWLEPADPNGVVTRYELSCQPLLLGISLPQPLSPGPTDRMTVLANLHPGVRYNCSIVASNEAGQSNLVYADGTTQETAPDGSPQSFIVIPSTGARNVTFSWSPLAPTLHNGIISGYFLFCVPEGVDKSTVSMWYTQSGTFTLEGFAPATTYNCSISASNSEGSGPVAYIMVATMDDILLFQLRLSGLPACQDWVNVGTSAKLTDIINAVVQNTEQLCRCGLGAEHITEDAFQCFPNSEQQVTFRARLHGTAQATSSQLLTNIETWVAQMDSTIAIQGVRLQVDSSCLLAISTFSDPECTKVVPTSDVTSTTGAIVGGVIAMLVILAVTITVIFVIKNRKTGSSIEQDMGNEPTKSSGAGVVITKREMHKLTKLGYDSEEAKQQSHELDISVTQCPAYVYTSQQGSGRVEEAVYESI